MDVSSSFLPFELSGWPRWDGLAARRIIVMLRHAAKAARRGQSAGERGIGRLPATPAYA
jgi:hypothetical protein